MQIKTAFVILGALAASAGCGSSGGPGSPQSGVTRASLHRAKTCPDLLADLKADTIYKLDKELNLQIRGIQACLAKYPEEQCAYGGYATHGGMAVDEAAPPQSAPAPTPSSNSGAGTSSDSKSSGATSYSETNTQVKGVDEADIIKNDAKYLYVLHGRAFKVLNAWPATDLKELSSIDIEGTPSEMFVADGKVVVYSQVNGASIFTAAGVQPKQQYTNYGFAYPATGGVAKDMPYPGGDPGQPYLPLTKVTVMTLNGTTPSVTREVYFEGSYLDARRVGQHVRTVFQGYAYGPKLKYGVYELYQQPDGTIPQDAYPKTGSGMISALESLRAANRSIVEASQLTDWLPYTFVKDGATVKASTVKCEDFYVPTTGSTENGLTEVASLDLANPAATPQETAILGRADTVYGNSDTLYLAAHAWVEPPFVWNGGPVSMGASSTAASPPPTEGSAPGASPKPQSLRPQADNLGAAFITHSSDQTHLHKFDFKSEPTFPNYVASGTVVGGVLNQFSLDEKDGRLRVATTESRQYVTADGQYYQPTTPLPGNVNRLFVLEQNGPWLDVRGDVGELAPNERIRSVRFIDNRGYVVTFRQVDPLFVVDLADAAKPSLLASLKIPGFSEYMHPLDGNHLLTIGRDATDQGRQQGLQLQIFDVTDGKNPLVVQKFTYKSDTYGSSEAEGDHKAFTYFADKNLLAFPYITYGTTSGMRSTLELFKVDTAAGFTKLGSIDHSGLVKQYESTYCGYYGPSVRRGVFLDNFVYSVSYGGVVARDANNLVAPLTDLPLPAPQNNDGYGPVCK